MKTQPELLGHHFTEACLPERAVPYWKMAAEIAIRRSAHVEAIGHFRRGLDLLKKLPDSPERIQNELEMQMSLGNTVMTIEGHGAPEVKSTLDRAMELCRQVGETPHLFPVLHGLWVYYVAHADLSIAHQFAEQCPDLSQRLRDPVHHGVSSCARIQLPMARRIHLGANAF